MFKNTDLLKRILILITHKYEELNILDRIFEIKDGFLEELNISEIKRIQYKEIEVYD